MGILETISKLVGIATGLLTIAEKCRNYIRDRKRSKNDPSDSLAAPDGSNGNSNHS